MTKKSSQLLNMYNLIRKSEFGSHDLRLTVQTPGTQLYAFTFVSCAVGECESPPS